MERCQEMSHITPTTALVAAIMTAATYHGRPGPRAMACVDGMTAAVSCLAVAGASRDEALAAPLRSEEHTSELQSQSNLVCRLLLEKKKNITSHRVLQYHLTRDYLSTIS